MCTAMTLQTKDHYFGRNLDLDHSYDESVIITPRNFPLPFRCLPSLRRHYALIGMAVIADGYPLYYDATNEHGLSMAGLNFPGNAVYLPIDQSQDNVAPFEFIPWILAQCKTIEEAKNLLSTINLARISYSDALPLTDLHWIISDRQSSIVVEPMESGVAVYENEVGVLTNNPPFPQQLRNLVNYANITPYAPKNRFLDQIPVTPDSLGLGAVGLPGDYSSQSRFVRTVFGRTYSQSDDSEESSVGQFFHILDSVSVNNGCVRLDNRNHKTVYSSCCNIDKGIYYYKTYTNNQISAVSLQAENLEDSEIQVFPLAAKQNIHFQN